MAAVCVCNYKCVGVYRLEFEVISSHYSGDMISLGIITCAIDPVKTCHLMLPHLMKKKSNMVRKLRITIHF